MSQSCSFRRRLRRRSARRSCTLPGRSSGRYPIRRIAAARWRSGVHHHLWCGTTPCCGQGDPHVCMRYSWVLLQAGLTCSYTTAVQPALPAVPSFLEGLLFRWSRTCRRRHIHPRGPRLVRPGLKAAPFSLSGLASRRTGTHRMRPALQACTPRTSVQRRVSSPTGRGVGLKRVPHIQNADCPSVTVWQLPLHPLG